MRLQQLLRLLSVILAGVVIGIIFPTPVVRSAPGVANSLVLFGWDYPKGLVSIDLASGSATALMSSSRQIESMAFDPSAGRLYGIENTSSSNILVLIDYNNSTITNIGTIFGFSEITGASFDVTTGRIYALDQTQVKLISIDPSTAVPTVIGNFGWGAANGLAIQPGTGQPFAILRIDPTYLAKVDRATGASTLIGSTGLLTSPALAFHPTTGILYSAGYVSGEGIRKLWTLDLATGAATAVGTLGTAGQQIVALEFGAYSLNKVPSADARGPYGGAEGTSISLSGTASDPDDDNLTISWTITPGAGTDPGAACQVANGNTLTPTITCNDDGGYTATLMVRDGKADPVTSDAAVTVTNVAPTITGIAGPTNALTGGAMTYTGTAADPSSLDTAAGFNWQWAVDEGVYSTFGSPKANTFQATFSRCGDHTISAKAKDDDDGVSAPFTTSVVKTYDLTFEQPLNEGKNNVVQKARVVPVKIAVGCGGASLSGLSPTIALVKGNVSPGTETAADEVTAYSSSAADTTGVMRTADGGYMYNLRVPDGPTVTSGDKFTVRVRPFGDGNPEAAEYVILIIK